MTSDHSSDTSVGRDQLTRRQAILAGTAPLLLASVGTDEPNQPAAVGPLLGHVDHNTALIWYRPGAEGRYTASLHHDSENTPLTATAEASVENDLCVVWRFDNLNPDTQYRYTISRNGQTLVSGDRYTIRTAGDPNTRGKVTLAMGSCASSTDFFDVWDQIAAQDIDALMLLGDTPYIDNRELSVNREKHRQFLSIPTLSALAASTPVWGTWDDHDFGGNDTDGRINNREVIRKVFTEYRAQTQFGDGIHGVYTKFRRGPVEVFLLDPRYFSQTEPSPVAADKPTCLGKTQWNWLLDHLRASTAPFKILATGMIWDDKKNGEKDDWETYSHEREALFDFIGKEQIKGVVLIGGDIHVSRHLKYPMTDRIGYDLHQFIISPLHDRVIPSLNVPHPHLQWGVPLKNMFLTVEVDSTLKTPTLQARWIDRTGEIHRHVTITLDA